LGRPRKYDWEDIERHYRSGMPESDIVRKFKCPRSSLNERKNKENWVVSEQAKAVVAGITNISEQINELNSENHELAKVAVDIGATKAEKLTSIQTVASNLLLRINESIINNEKIELVRVKQYVDGKVDSETVEQVVVGHGAKDHKDFADAIDKIAVTTGAAERHAPKTEINNTNAQQNNTTLEYTLDEQD